MRGSGPSRWWVGWATTLGLVLGIASAGAMGCSETRAQPAHPDGGSASASGERKVTRSKGKSSKHAKRKGDKNDKAGDSKDDKAGGASDGAPEADFEVAAEVGATQRGESVWYSNSLHGSPTASGERFSRYKMTAAHRTLPMGTTVRVTHRKNHASVVVRINDRGPFGKKRHRIIDVSEAAAKILDIIEDGRGPVLLEVLTLPESRKDKAR